MTIGNFSLPRLLPESGHFLTGFRTQECWLRNVSRTQVSPRPLFRRRGDLAAASHRVPYFAVDRVDFTCHGLYYRFSEGRHASLHCNEQKGDVLIEVVSSTTSNGFGKGESALWSAQVGLRVTHAREKCCDSRLYVANSSDGKINFGRLIIIIVDCYR